MPEVIKTNKSDHFAILYYWIFIKHVYYKKEREKANLNFVGDN